VTVTVLPDILLLAIVLVAWGAQVVLPWRCRPAAADGPRAGGPLVLLGPLALAGVVAAYYLVDRNPDAAIAAHLVPLLATRIGALLAVLVPAQLAAALVATVAGRRLDPLACRILVGLGLATCIALGAAQELLRAGGGPTSSELFMLFLVACRLALSLAAGELVAPGRPRGAVAAGLTLPLYPWLLPLALRREILHQGLAISFGAAALLLLAARWLPQPLRRPALAGGVLLAAIALTQTAQIAQALTPLALPQ
jgi:hypothetical protein